MAQDQGSGQLSAKGLSRGALARKGRYSSPATRQFLGWMKAEALPHWARKGWDSRLGAFHERLFFDGTPDALVQRRTRVQWRQIYVFAHASLLGWTDGLKLAFQALETMLARAWAPDGKPGFVHVLAPDGAVIDDTRDTYDHSFALLALAWLARASGDAQVRALLDLVYGFCMQELTDENGFLHEALPPRLPHRQNPHMHMFEAMLAMVETQGHAEAALQAARYRAMLDRTFLDQDSGLLVEEFDEHWKPQITNGAAPVEPGHMAEWVWLIRKYERLSGLKPSPLGTHLIGAAIRAVEPKSGFLIDEIDTLQRVRKASRRLWPQTELIKAWLAHAEQGGDRADEAAEQVIEAMMGSYLSGPFPGGWYDSYDAEGNVAVQTVPASSLYHVFLAAAETERLFGG